MRRALALTNSTILTPPVVVATAVDDLTDRELSDCAVCAVSVLGKPGAYHAKIMVRNVSNSNLVFFI
jgi:hypothetical protein